MVRLDDVSYLPPGGEVAVLHHVDLRLRPGECALLGGPTGSGKSTLLRVIADALPLGGRTAGRIERRGRPVLLFQNVETQLLFSTVAGEVMSGPLHAGAPEQRARELAARSLARVGLAGFEGRTVDALSAGEKQRVVLAALLALEPAILLLDEPTSALDAPGRERLVAVLASLRAAGHAILVADHRLEPFRGIASGCWWMKEGTPHWTAEPPPSDLVHTPPPALPVGGEAVVGCEGLGVCDAEGRWLLADVALALRPHERVLVTGPNGCGKTTLLRALAGLLPPTRGRVSAAAALGPTGIGFLFQDPLRGLFEDTVEREVAFSLRRRGWSAAAVRRRVDEVLSLCGLSSLRARSPFQLSFGEQHRLTLAAALAPEPRLLLLDEPFSGLDAEARLRLCDLLAREQQRTGAAVVVASHDEQPLRRWVHRSLRLAGGRMRDA